MFTWLPVRITWNDYYNFRRPHSAIRYLVLADYYRGNPDARIAERKGKTYLRQWREERSTERKNQR
ncbi:hypothetical protein GF312_00110 [Candidatus Poribacteria bacterium]|nr:hypothetical protein [Candidatus Poribacteria bacterium]